MEQTLSKFAHDTGQGGFGQAGELGREEPNEVQERQMQGPVPREEQP